MAWMSLTIAGLFEIVWVLAMKQSQGFTRLWPSALSLTAMAVSMGLLAYSLRSLPVGLAYAVWTGIGAAGAFLAGVLFLGEELTLLRGAAVLLIVSGLILLKLSALG